MTAGSLRDVCRRLINHRVVDGVCRHARPAHKRHEIDQRAARNTQHGVAFWHDTAKPLEIKTPPSVSIDAGAVLEVGPNLVRVEALTTEGTELTRSFYVLGEKEAE